MDGTMNGRNLPPRYRAITPDSQRGRDPDWSLEPEEDEAAAVAPVPQGSMAEARHWRQTGLFLVASAIGGVAAALLGLIPDVWA